MSDIVPEVTAQLLANLSSSGGASRVRGIIQRATRAAQKGRRGVLIWVPGETIQIRFDGDRWCCHEHACAAGCREWNYHLGRSSVLDELHKEHGFSYYVGWPLFGMRRVLLRW